MVEAYSCSYILAIGMVDVVTFCKYIYDCFYFTENIVYMLVNTVVIIM